MQVSSRRIADIHDYLNIPPEIHIASMVVKLSDEMNKVFKEQPSYDGYEFLANIGGNAGLILGNFMYYKIGPKLGPLWSYIENEKTQK